MRVIAITSMIVICVMSYFEHQENVIKLQQTKIIHDTIMLTKFHK